MCFVSSLVSQVPPFFFISLIFAHLQIFLTVDLPFFLLKYLLHGFPGLFTVISGHMCFLLLVFFLFFLHFLVDGSVR